MSSVLRFFSLSAVVLAVSLSGCSKDSQSGGGGQPAQPVKEPKLSATELFKGDMKAIDTLDEAALSKFDLESGGIFTKIFGGPTVASLKQYIDTRLKYFVAVGEPDVSFDPEVLNALLEEQKAGDGTKARVGAVNIGMAAWKIGLIYHAPIGFNYHGKKVPVDNSRVGIMAFGEAYEATMTTLSGKVWNLPATFRQSIIAHEARHSDCTGGITEQDLSLDRSGNKDDSEYKARACGHLHIRCPKGHELEDLYGCDDESWGAYSVGMVYAAAMKEVEKDNEENWQLVNAMAIDSDGRLTIPARIGNPDMSSSGLKQFAPSQIVPGT